MCGAEHHSYDRRFIEGYKTNNRPNDEKGIDKNWLENINVVGVTAGASAPEEIVRRVVDHLQSSKDVEVEGLELQDEHVQFVLPRELIQLKNP